MVGFNLAWWWCGAETHVQGNIEINERPLMRLGLMQSRINVPDIWCP